MPLNLLLILAVSGITVVYGTYPPVHQLLAAGFVAAAATVIIRAAPRLGVAPSEQIDERDTNRVLTIGAYAGVLAVGAIALLIAFVWPSLALAFLGLVALWIIVWWPRRLRTFSLTTNIVIERDPATVFAFISNLENQPKYQPIVERMEKVTPGPIGIGTRFSARARMPASLKIGERIFEGTEEIVDFEPNHRLISRTSSGLNSNLDVKTFDAVPNGTLVTHRFDFVHSYPSAVIGTTLLFGPNADRVQRANRADSWARAKQILESDGQATP